MSETLAAAFEREHHEIDDGIERFLAAHSAGRATDPEAVRSVHRAIDALRRHIYLEEEFAFPPLQGTHLFAAISVMLHEHGQIWTTLDRLEHELALDPASPATRAECELLVTRLSAHNAKEEPIIYPSFDSALPEDVAERLREFQATGTMPEGWLPVRVRG